MNKTQEQDKTEKAPPGSKEAWPQVLLPDAMWKVFTENATNIARIAKCLEVIAEESPNTKFEQMDQRFTKMGEVFKNLENRLSDKMHRMATLYDELETKITILERTLLETEHKIEARIALLTNPKLK